MTWMRKLMDLLNMDNWERYRDDSDDEELTIEEETTAAPKTNIIKNPTPIKSAQQIPSAPAKPTANLSLEPIKLNDKPATATDINSTYFKSDDMPSDTIPSHIVSILKYWKYPHSDYRCDKPEATSEEYKYFATVLFLYWYGKLSSPQNMNHCPPTYLVACHISNPKNLYFSLIQNGYLGQPSVLDILSAKTIADLKIIAARIDCKKGGNKKELISRIYNHLNDEEKNNILSSCELYSLTEKGKHFLYDNFDYVELYKHHTYNVTLAEYNNKRISFGKNAFNDTVFHVISERIYMQSSHDCFLHVTYEYLSLYDIEYSEGRYDAAIKDYLTFLYLKTCCLDNLDFYSRYHYLSPCFNSDYTDNTIFTLKNARVLVDLSDYYSDSLVDFVYALHYPPSLLTRDEFVSAMHDMIEQTIFDYPKYNTLIGQRIGNIANRFYGYI